MARQAAGSGFEFGFVFRRSLTPGGPAQLASPGHKAIVGARKTSKATAVWQFLNKLQSRWQGSRLRSGPAAVITGGRLGFCAIRDENGSRRSKWFTGLAHLAAEPAMRGKSYFGFTTAPSASVVQDWGGAALWLALCQAGRRALQVVRDLCRHGQLNSWCPG